MSVVVDAAGLKRVPKRPYGLWAVDALIVLLAAGLLFSISTNPRFQWDVVGKYIFTAPVMRGLLISLQLTILAVLLGSLIGVVLAALSTSRDPILKGFASFYVWFFRGTPLLVQLIFWFNIAALYPMIRLGVPFGPTLFEFSGNSISPFMAGLLGLTLHEGAYMAEIVRGGILAVGKGQTEAASSLGMRKLQAFVRITLPQALRVIVPATGNQIIMMLKTTSIVSVIAIPELLYAVQNIYSRTFEVIPLLMVAALWYLFLVSLLTFGQGFLERYLGRGYASKSSRRRRKGREAAATTPDAEAG